MNLTYLRAEKVEQVKIRSYAERRLLTEERPESMGAELGSDHSGRGQIRAVKRCLVPPQGLRPGCWSASRPVKSR